MDAATETQGTVVFEGWNFTPMELIDFGRAAESAFGFEYSVSKAPHSGWNLTLTSRHAVRKGAGKVVAAYWDGFWAGRKSVRQGRQ